MTQNNLGNAYRIFSSVRDSEENLIRAINAYQEAQLIRTRDLFPVDYAMTLSNLGIAYKSLSKVERAFRCMKTVDLHVRPIYLRLEKRVRGHVLLCMLAYYVEWHMRKALCPILFAEDDHIAKEQQRTSPVEPAQPSESAKKKARTKKTADGEPVHSFATLMNDLRTVVRNEIRRANDCEAEEATFTIVTTPTPLQKRALELLEVPVPT